MSLRSSTVAASTWELRRPQQTSATDERNHPGTSSQPTPSGNGVQEKAHGVPKEVQVEEAKAERESRDQSRIEAVARLEGEAAEREGKLTEAQGMLGAAETGMERHSLNARRIDDLSPSEARHGHPDWSNFGGER